MEDISNIPINAYDEMVKDLIKTDSTLVFENISAEHAKFIIRSFVDSAKQSIEILSGSFCNQFYTGMDFYDYIKKAAQKISSPQRIRIITMNDTDYMSIIEKFNQINKDIGCNVISYIPCKYTGEEPIPHFLVVDNKRYREEESHQDFGQEAPQKVKASVCCNGTKKARELVSWFNALWGTLEEDQALMNAQSYSI